MNFNSMFDQTIHYLKTIHGQIDKLIDNFDNQNQLLLKNS